MNDHQPSISGGLTLSLADGRPALLRPVSPEDRERLCRGLTQLSEESRYHRFFCRVDRFSERQLRYFTEVDQVNHVAWSALDPSVPGAPGLGVGRFVRSAGDPELAEWALTVVDPQQRRGVGTLLAAALYLAARRRGIRVLYAAILPGNWFVANWFQNLGGVVIYGDELCEIALPVHRDFADLPRTASAERFRGALERIDAAGFSVHVA